MKKQTAKNGKKKGKLYVMRVLLTALCLAVSAFIFCNSATPADRSAAQSDFVTNLVQKTVKVLAPNSWAANATGRDYERLHSMIRTFAHFCEFALLGALLIWAFRAYTKRAYLFLLPICLVLLVPVLDETLQAFTAGRVADVADLYVDTLGGFCGAAFAGLTLLCGKLVLLKKHKNKRIG